MLGVFSGMVSGMNFVHLRNGVFFCLSLTCIGPLLGQGTASGSKADLDRDIAIAKLQLEVFDLSFWLDNSELVQLRPDCRVDDGCRNGVAGTLKTYEQTRVAYRDNLVRQLTLFKARGNNDSDWQTLLKRMDDNFANRLKRFRKALVGN